MFGPWEWVLVGTIAILVFGVGPFKKAASGLGQGVSEFKKGMRGQAEPEEDEERKEPEAEPSEAGEASA